MTLPNQLTILRIILTPIFAITLFKDGLSWKYISVGIFIFASLTDFYDGIIARKYGNITQMGKFLDPLADKILVSTALVCLSRLGYVKLWMVVVIISRDVLITALRSYAMYRNYPIQTMMLAKWKTATQDFVVYFVLMIMLAEEQIASMNGSLAIIDFIINHHFICYMMWLVTGLTVYTGLIYLIDNRNHMKTMLRDFFHVFAPLDL